MTLNTEVVVTQDNNRVTLEFPNSEDADKFLRVFQAATRTHSRVEMTNTLIQR
jgi:hypothetical protein